MGLKTRFESTLSDDLVAELMNAGLNKQQATSQTAEIITKLYMSDDGKVLIGEAEKQADGIIREAQRQVSEMDNLVSKLRKDYRMLCDKIEMVSDTILAIDEAQKEHGDVTDDRAKNTIALYGALLSMNKRAKADSDASVRSAGYVTYAYLGGQARRIYLQSEKKNTSKNTLPFEDDEEYVEII